MYELVYTAFAQATISGFCLGFEAATEHPGFHLPVSLWRRSYFTHSNSLPEGLEEPISHKVGSRKRGKDCTRKESLH
eukprot:scaffold284604_cov17-Tisochrysis_lutea.AAC.1